MPLASPAPVRWQGVPSLRHPDDECRTAREAFARVAPGGFLPEHPTALQRLLHTRMVTSAFIAAMQQHRTGARRVPAG